MGSQRVRFDFHIPNEVLETGWLKQQKFIFSQFWRVEPEIKGLAGLASSVATLLELQMAIYFMHLHMAFPPYLPTSRFPLLKRIPVILVGPILMTSF